MPRSAIVESGAMFDGVLQAVDMEMPPAREHLARPSEREFELLLALSEGMTNAAIGHQMAISPRTVESHLRRMFVRYRVGCRAQLLMLAVHQGWVD